MVTDPQRALCQGLDPVSKLVIGNRARDKARKYRYKDLPETEDLEVRVKWYLQSAWVLC